MTMRTVVALVSLLAISACAGGPGRSDTPAETPEEIPVASNEPTPTASLKLSSVQPSRAPSDADEVIGVLGADSIEGGCGYLQASNGTRFEVIYPEGWRLQLSPLQLTSPNGEIVARGGDEVTVRGAIATDMASICQIGPIFRAAEVVTG